MRETAREIRQRLLREAWSARGAEAAQSLEQQLRATPDVRVPYHELNIATLVVEAEILPGDPWSLPFVLGVVKQPEYRELIHCISEPTAVLRANFISGAAPIRRRLNALILSGGLLTLGAGLLCVIVGFGLRNVLMIGAGVGLWVVRHFLLSNLQTLTNIQVAARLNLYDAEAAKVGRPIVLEIEPERCVSVEEIASRRGWKDLDLDYLRALARQFGTASEMGAFVRLCERTGILRDNLPFASRVGGSHVEFGLRATASTLTSYGEHLANSRRWRSAADAFAMAIRIKDDHIPAYLGLSSMYTNRRRYPEALALLASAPRQSIDGNSATDATFDLAFQRTTVLSMKFTRQLRTEDRYALIAAVQEAIALGERPIEAHVDQAASGIGIDLTESRAKKMKFLYEMLDAMSPR